MNLFRYIIFALSVALIFSVGSSSATIHSHPEISVADDRTLSLRETGSQIVMETIEDAIRQGGLALFDGKFQIDSSLNWVFGERIEGEVDVVVPLWSGDGHVVFAQPGLALWTGIADEDRIDTNLGVVYRTNLLNTLTGIDVISGVSVFYDNNFRRGHSRVSIGMDAQHREFRGAFNYYEPLSDDKRGRAGYIEDAIRGMDARFAFQRDIMRLSANLGYWRYEGDGRSKSEWELSYGLDASVRIVDGVFIEGGYEKHDDDASIGERLNLGVAFKFSLPDFKGRSYEDVSMSSNLYQIVKREKRILYEERESDGIILSASGEGNTRNVSVQLRRAATEEVVLNLIGTGSATYNDDWTISVGGDDCPVVDGTDCSVTVMAGETSPSDEVLITFQDPARGEPAEDIILSVEVASGGGANLLPGNPLVVRIPEGEPLPTVSLNYSGSRTIDGNSIVRQTIELSEALSDSITVTLTASGTADYDSDLENGTWNLAHAAVAEGMTPADAFPFSDADFCSNTAITGTGCEIIISVGQTIVDLAMNSKVLTSGETIELALGIGSASTSLVALGSSPRVDFVIEAPPLPTVTMSATNTTIMEGLQRVITFTLSEMVSEPVTLNLIADTSSTATYGGTDDWVLNDGSGACASATGMSCQITIPANSTTATTRILVIDNMAGEGEETAIVRVEVDSGSRHLVQEGSPSSLTFTIPADPPSTLGFADTGITTDETIGGNQRISAIRGVVKDASGMKLSSIPVRLPFTVSIANNENDINGIDPSIEYELTPSGTTSFNSDNEFVIFFPVIVDDMDIEGEEMIVITLGEGPNFPSGWIVDPNANTFTITINANDQPSTLGFAETGITVNEGRTIAIRGVVKDASGMKLSSIPVRLPVTFSITNNDDGDINIDTGSGLALTPTSTTNFNSDNEFIMHIFATRDDTTPEPQEEFVVTLGEGPNFPSGWIIDPNANTFTITVNANDQPTISFSGGHGSDPTKIEDAIDEGMSGSATLTITISPAPTSQISIPLTTTGSHAAYGDSFAVTGATLTGKPSTNDVMLSVPANTGTVTLTITAAQDGADGRNDITVSLGTPLPGNYIAGTASIWEIAIHDDDG